MTKTCYNVLQKIANSGCDKTISKASRLSKEDSVNALKDEAGEVAKKAKRRKITDDILNEDKPTPALLKALRKYRQNLMPEGESVIG